jgi:uncharacterized protein with HEPN domain
MPLESLKFLEDILQAAERIREFAKGRTEANYAADAMLRSAVERQFEIIGEAVNQLKRVDPGTAGRIENYQEIIAFRNILIHNYDDIEPDVVWDVVQTKLPALLQQVRAIISEDPHNE